MKWVEPASMKQMRGDQKSVNWSYSKLFFPTKFEKREHILGQKKLGFLGKKVNFGQENLGS